MGLDPQILLRLGSPLMPQGRRWSRLLRQKGQHGLALSDIYPRLDNHGYVDLPILPVRVIRVAQVPARKGPAGGSRRGGAWDCVQE